MKAFSSKKRLLLLGGFLIAFLLVLTVSTYILYTQAKDYLDKELGERLRSIAVALSHTVEISTNGSLQAKDISPALRILLHTARTENLLSNIVVLTPDGNTVLDVPHLALNRGEILTLLGENGSGKTTLLRLLGLLIRPECGAVYRIPLRGAAA